MILIDAEKFLSYLIFSKHIDSLRCEEVKEAVEKCKVDVFKRIKSEIRKKITFNSFNEGIVKYDDILEVIDKNVERIEE